MIISLKQVFMLERWYINKTELLNHFIFPLKPFVNFMGQASGLIRVPLFLDVQNS